MIESLRVGIGLDIGEKRIGVARGDSDVKLASPLAPIANTVMALGQIIQVIRDQSANFIVAGLPRNSQGVETAQSEYSRQFVERLRMELAKTDLPVSLYFQDESLTSVRAEEILRARNNFHENQLRDGTLDSEAATIILGDFLNSQSEVYRA